MTESDRRVRRDPFAPLRELERVVYEHLTAFEPRSDVIDADGTVQHPDGLDVPADVEPGGPIMVGAAALSATGGTPALTVVNDVPAWLLDSATDESIGVNVPLPAAWEAVTVAVWWTSTVADAGDIALSVAASSAEPGDTVGPPGAPTVEILTHDGQHIAMRTELAEDTPASGLLSIVVGRDADNTADTLAGDVAILAFEIHPGIEEDDDEEPIELPTAFLDYDADNLAFADAADADGWVDAGPNGWDTANPAPSGTFARPVYDADGINGHPAVYWPTVAEEPKALWDFYLEPTPEGNQAKEDFTVLWVGEVTASGDQSVQLFGHGNNDEWINLYISTSSVSIYSKSSSPFSEAYAEDTGGVSAGVHVIAAKRNSTGVYLYVDGVEVASDLVALSPTQFGRIIAPVGQRGGRVSVTRVYDSDQDAVALSAPLMTKYVP